MGVRVEAVEDPADARIEAYRAVRDPERVRRRGGFLVEGRACVRVLLASGRARVRSLALTDASLAALAPDLERVATELRVYRLSPEALRATSGVRFHQGCVAEAELPPEPPLPELMERAARRGAPLLFLERLSDPDNVGSVFRNALAFGAAAVVLSPGCASPLYRKALRTSMGAGLQVPFARDAGWPDALQVAARWGYVRVALTPEPSAAGLDVAFPRGAAPAPVALVLGSEGGGLSALAREACDRSVRIPMVSGADSVNVATASGIALHHFFEAGAAGSG